MTMYATEPMKRKRARTTTLQRMICRYVVVEFWTPRVKVSALENVVVAVRTMATRKQFERTQQRRSRVRKAR
jgi:hypothetical protein